MIKRLAILTAIMLLTGCSTIPDTPITEDSVQQEEQQKQEQPQHPVVKNERSPVADDPFYAPIEPARKPTPITVTGSLFNSDTAHSLYSYSAPYAIGDSITVILKENASASKSASSTLENSNNYTLDPIKIPGGELTVNGKVVELELNKALGFDGTSGADQQHSLSARITVTVVDILNNGNLKVRGEKWLVINNGNEYMRFTGIIRPLDISEDNTVESAQVADTRIEFSGTGDHAKVQKQGWLSSLLGSSL
jgi:flagellar L-ring protein precursor FlgH